ncbi:D-alanine--D-alanine ligase family protein [Alkalibacterium kapii]|uniref:D-alanine--D-alanine ligase n=1 Tax=Alkalibacterium kapii TaxID=426704 RepID=A0A511AV49_9LACT|nr:D-alanine--D-alanine ligase family protein [Alkalibacterium kapii]GEK92075.1 D-alanine--D-alanine ligase [Alkalibacterium kapii]
MKIYVIYGGKNAEHEVSVKSAFSILQHIYYDYHTIIPIYITREGTWYKGSEVKKQESFHSIAELVDLKHQEEFSFNELIEEECLAFPVLHGPNGEDGTIQGLFETLNIPYVGSGVLASAVGMDKIISKGVFKEAGLPVLPYKEVKLREWKVDSQSICENIETHIPYPMYVKPVNQGSSIGITRVLNRDELTEAIDLAFDYDHRIIIEKGVSVREIEVAILGNEDVHTSLPGELVKQKPFYAYEDKYLNQKVVREIPAKLSDELTRKVRKMAAEAFEVINGSGISRADFFLTEEETIYINEVNTFPGFTINSMYPKVWAKTGIPFGDLIEEVIQLGMRRYKDKHKTSTEITTENKNIEMESIDAELDT